MRNLTFGVLVRRDNGQRFRIRDDVVIIGQKLTIATSRSKSRRCPGCTRSSVGKMGRWSWKIWEAGTAPG